MKRVLLALVLAVSFGGLSGIARAQNAHANAGTQYKKVTNYDFEDDTVTGELVRPDGDFVGSRKGTVHSSLIKLRANFVPEMIKTANEI